MGFSRQQGVSSPGFREVFLAKLHLVKKFLPSPFSANKFIADSSLLDTMSQKGNRATVATAGKGGQGRAA